MLKIVLLASSLLLVSFPSTAQHVYVWRDANGVVNYSDMPPVGGAVGDVRKLRVRTLTAVPGSSSTPSSTPSQASGPRVGSIASGRTRDRLSSETEREISAGGSYGGGGVVAGDSSGSGASSFGGSGTEGGAQPVAAGPSPTPGGTTTASSAPNVAVPIATAPAPNVAVPISTAPAPDQAVPVATAPAPDVAVPVSTAPAPDLAVPVSTTPVTATSSATTAPSVGTPTSGGSSGSTWSQIAGGSSDTGQATLYWDEVTKPPISTIPVAGYRVYFGEGPSAYLQPYGEGINAGNVTSYTVQGLKTGTQYYFTVTTYVGGSESPYASEVSKLVTAP